MIPRFLKGALKIIGSLLITTGAGVLLFGLPGWDEPPRKIDESEPDHRIWTETTEVIRRHAEPNALIITWRNNAQWVRLLTGLETWTRDESPDGNESRFWQVLGGGPTEDAGPSKALARWFTLDAGEAINALKAELPRDRPVYFLITVDDLARLPDMTRLGGRPLSVQSASLPLSGDIHGTIRSVKQWAAGLNAPGYLVRQEGLTTLRAWTYPDGKGQDALLFRLLPFSNTLSQPLPEFQLVYQSGWGGYLSLYRWTPRAKD